MLWRRLDDLWPIFGPPGWSWELQGVFFIDLGYHFEVRGAHFWDEKHPVDHDFSMHVSIGGPGCIFIGFLVGPGAFRHEKPCKIVVLSLKIKVLLNNVKVELGRSPDPIFIDFLSFWEPIWELLDHPMASLLEVDFSIDFEKNPSWPKSHQKPKGRAKRG